MARDRKRIAAGQQLDDRESYSRRVAIIVLELSKQH